MANWYSDQLATVESYLGTTAIAGVAGGAQMIRATEYRGIGKIHRFSVANSNTHPIPNSPPGSFATGDTIQLTWMKPVERIYFGQVFYTPGMGAGATMSYGKLDKNNPANTDPAHYLVAGDASGTLATVQFNLNMTEQVGVDPIGDFTVGQTLPMFGSDNIALTSTLAGTSPNTTGGFYGWVLCVEEGN